MGEGTDIGRVRGMGSAKKGGQHWIDQRLSALGNLLLTAWLVISLIMLPNFGHDTLAAWLRQPSVAVPMMLMLLSICWHIKLGLQVLIEDYFPDEGNKLAALVVLNFYVAGCAAFGIFTIARLAFSAVAAVAAPGAPV